MSTAKSKQAPQATGPKVQQQVSNKVLTVPNVISVIRLCMIPLFLVLLFHDYNFFAALAFGIAAATDFLDGLIARSTNSVTRLGQVLDPVVDRALIISGVLGIFLVGRIPLWLIIVVLGRDAIMLCIGGYLLLFQGIRVPVVFIGKVATAFLFFGFAFLLVNWPMVSGLGITTLPWLPGFTAAPVSIGIFFVYIGAAIGVCTMFYYGWKAFGMLRNKQAVKQGTNHVGAR